MRWNSTIVGMLVLGVVYSEAKAACCSYGCCDCSCVSAVLEKKAEILDAEVGEALQSFSVNVADDRKSGTKWQCALQDEVALCTKH